MSDTFDHEADAWDSLNDELDYDEDGRAGRPRPKCNRCGSTDVRWRQQGGKWVLFSLKPGIEHTCPVVDEFDVLPD